MALIVTGWKPSLRNIVFTPRPEWVPEWVYTQAIVAKRAYNENWEFWVYQESLKHNKSMSETEDACIRGIQKEINRYKFIYGPKIGAWFEEFLDMGDIFRKVRMPDYLPKLG